MQKETFFEKNKFPKRNLAKKERDFLRQENRAVRFPFFFEKEL